MFNFGGAAVDTVAWGPYEEFIEHHSIFHASFDPEIQILFPATSGLRPYIALGASLNFVRYEEEFFLLNEPSRAVDLRDDGEESGIYLQERRFSPSANGAFGVNIVGRRNFGVGLVYAFKYWHPVKYDYDRGLPLTGIPYWERFLTHTFRFNVSVTMEED
jgi:hypothetical protein